MNRQTFALPDLGEGLTEAEIVRWLVAEGDEVRVDQPVVEVETAKSVVEVPTPFAGRVVVLHGQEGQTVEVGTPLISVDADSDDAARYREEERAGGSGNVLVGFGTDATVSTGRRRRRPRTVPAPAAGTGAVNGAAPLVVSPLVRRLARDRGIDVRELTGTGPGGVVTRGDVEHASNGSRAPERALPTADAVTVGVIADGAVERRVPLSLSGKAAAANLARSRAEIPEATVWVDVDATGLVELREAARTPDDPGPGLIAYLAAFVVAALRDFPVFNARFDAARNETIESAQINLGLAIQGERGLVVPAVVGAESLSIARLDQEIDAITARARVGKVTAAELSAGTFTLNNYGRFGVDGSAAIINHPQVAILGVGRILDRPWVVRGEIQPRKITQLSFVFDHRVADGGTAAGFLRAVADAIENPVLALARR